MEDKVTLYIATHNITGKKYFGKTTRFFTQESLQENYTGSGKYWNKHKKKHGDDVTMEIYCICSLNESDEDYVVPIALKFSEENNIVKDKEKWANLMSENGLDGGVKGQYSEDTRKRLSESKTGVLNHMYGKTGENCPFYGKNHTADSRAKMSESAKNRQPISEDTRKRLSESKTGENNPMYGKTHSEETKSKISEALIGENHPMYGNTHSEETKSKMSSAHNGNTHSEETKIKMRKPKTNY